MSTKPAAWRWVSAARWFLAVSYGLGAPWTAVLEYRQQLLSQHFDIPPVLVYASCAVQFACALAVLTRPLAMLGAAGLTVTTMGAMVLHLRIGSPMTAWTALLYTGIQVWFGLRCRTRRARPG